MNSEPKDHSGFAIHSAFADLADGFFQTLVVNASEGLLTIDTDSRIVFANAAIEDILGYSPNELVGSSKLEIVPERLRPVHERQFARYLETGEKHIDWDGVQLPALHKDGREVPVTISFRRHEFDGEPLFTGVFRDISDLKAKERQLERQNERLEKFAEILSHDVRNPLNIAQAYAESLADDVERQELENVSEALDRMEEIVDDMLTLVEAGRSLETLECVSLHRLATEAWRWVETVDAELAVENEERTIRADRSQVTSLFENLFTNAVVHGGSDVTVRVGFLEESNGFYVEDTGDGIAEQHREDVFEHGYTTRTEGTGLGLSIVQAIAETHGWTVAMTESDGGGARFEFHL
ncbi:two-component system sensor histidine kinase NtrB [Natronococcus sp.]|uniref:two-component system sensor histidine kinase NtrB n=1 Tax=Natronococcus sp. TaxID=35747 RepID=UPI003A4E2A0F